MSNGGMPKTPASRAAYIRSSFPGSAWGDAKFRKSVALLPGKCQNYGARAALFVISTPFI